MEAYCPNCGELISAQPLAAHDAEISRRARGEAVFSACHCGCTKHDEHGACIECGNSTFVEVTPATMPMLLDAVRRKALELASSKLKGLSTFDIGDEWTYVKRIEVLNLLDWRQRAKGDA